jgi:hypothetical protein
MKSHNRSSRYGRDMSSAQSTPSKMSPSSGRTESRRSTSIQDGFPITSLTCGGSRGRDWIAVGQLDGMVSIIDPRNGGGSGGMGVVARWKAHESAVVCLRDIGAQQCTPNEKAHGGGKADEDDRDNGDGVHGGGKCRLASSCLVSMSVGSSVRIWNVDNIG